MSPRIAGILALASSLYVTGCELPTEVVPVEAYRAPLFNIGTPPNGVTTAVLASGDTYVRQGRANKNFGDEESLHLRARSPRRVLVQFDQEAIQNAVGDATLLAAELELSITSNGNKWGRRGRSVAVHRMTQSWTEAGATWNCANDVNTSNNRPDCDGSGWRMSPRRWGGRPWARRRTATTRIRSRQTGAIKFDVTRDVTAFLAGENPNHGWLIKTLSERHRGRVEFGSRESQAPPRLLLTVEQGSGRRHHNPGERGDRHTSRRRLDHLPCGLFR